MIVNLILLSVASFIFYVLATWGPNHRARINVLKYDLLVLRNELLEKAAALNQLDDERFVKADEIMARVIDGLNYDNTAIMYGVSKEVFASYGNKVATQREPKDSTGESRHFSAVVFMKFALRIWIYIFAESPFGFAFVSALMAIVICAMGLSATKKLLVATADLLANQCASMLVSSRVHHA